MHLEEALRQHNIDVSSLSLPAYQRAGEEHPIYLLRFPAAQVLTQWEILRELVPETGYWPVIGCDRFKQPPREAEPTQGVLEAGSDVDVQQWFAQQWLEQYGENVARWNKSEKREASQAPAHFALLLHRGRFSWTLPPLAPIALVPTSDFWEVPAYISMQTNEWGPPDAVHIAIMKYWNKRWKVELVSMVSGMVEMRVLQPPSTIEESLALAREQYLYSPDIVDQWLGGNLNTLARILVNAHVWRFWWD